MSSVVISGDSSGAITLAAPAVAGTNTATLPAATGTVMVSGNMPAFSAYATSNQSISANTSTKVLFDSKNFDTNNNFASSRFTPTVAGYYQFIAGVSSTTASTVNPWFINIAKNGAQTLVNGYVYPLSTGVIQVSGLLYLNGSTDYVEIYVYQGNMAQTVFGRSDQTYFQGSMVRTA
jgi:hypothetical protein